MFETAETETPRSMFILRAGGFCASAAITISTLLCVLWWLRPSRIGDAVVGFAVIWVFAAIPAGVYGFFAGVLGGGWFSIRRGRIASLARLLVEAAALGILLSLLEPPLRSVLLNWSEQTSTPTNDFLYGATEWFFSLGVGCITALLYAYLFRRTILRRERGATAI